MLSQKLSESEFAMALASLSQEEFLEWQTKFNNGYKRTADAQISALTSALSSKKIRPLRAA
jgi:hypothetical protein